jgi:hypothetical protein
MAAAAETEHGRLVFENEFPAEFRELIPEFYWRCMKFCMKRTFRGKMYFNPSELAGFQVEIKYATNDHDCIGCRAYRHKYCVHLNLYCDPPIQFLYDPENEDSEEGEMDILGQFSMCLDDDDDDDDDDLLIVFGGGNGEIDEEKEEHKWSDIFTDIVERPLEIQWKKIKRSNRAFKKLRRAEIGGDDGDMESTDSKTL